MSEPVEDEAYLLSVVRYIHKNPEKASMGDAERYRWSSYAEYLEQPRLASTSLIMGILGSPKAFVCLHKRDEDEPAVMDVPSTRMMVCDEEALNLAKAIAGAEELEQLKGANREKRDRVLCELKAAGLGVRQIQRLTGISLGVISKA